MLLIVCVGDGSSTFSPLEFRLVRYNRFWEVDVTGSQSFPKVKKIYLPPLSVSAETSLQ